MRCCDVVHTACEIERATPLRTSMWCDDVGRIARIELTENDALTRKVDVRLTGKGNLNFNDARPVHPIITMIKWVRAIELSIKELSLSDSPSVVHWWRILATLASSGYTWITP